MFDLPKLISQKNTERAIAILTGEIPIDLAPL